MPNDKSAKANTALLNKWKECPGPPSCDVKCKGAEGKCIDLRHEKCDSDVLHGKCAGSNNIKCCPPPPAPPVPAPKGKDTGGDKGKDAGGDTGKDTGGDDKPAPAPPPYINIVIVIA